MIEMKTYPYRMAADMISLSAHRHLPTCLCRGDASRPSMRKSLFSPPAGHRRSPSSYAPRPCRHLPCLAHPPSLHQVLFSGPAASRYSGSIPFRVSRSDSGGDCFWHLANGEHIPSLSAPSAPSSSSSSHSIKTGPIISYRLKPGAHAMPFTHPQARILSRPSQNLLHYPPQSLPAPWQHSKSRSQKNRENPNSNERKIPFPSPPNRNRRHAAVRTQLIEAAPSGSAGVVQELCRTCAGLVRSGVGVHNFGEWVR